MDNLKSLIREVPDFPKPGILFYDITTLLKDKAGLRGVIDALCDHYRDAQVDMVLGIEARGFIFAPALAYALGAGFRSKDKAGLRGVIDALCDHYRDAQVDMVLGIEARGFIFAPALAYALGAGF